MNREPQPKDARARAFTLVELLVVIAIIAVLASMLIPALAAAKESSRRAACVSNVHQFLLSAQLYANDNNNALPLAGTDNRSTTDTHTPVFGTKAASNFLAYTTLKALDCPNLHKWMERPNWRNHPDYGIAVGYHYLGGHPATPWDPPPGTTNRWISPQLTTDDPALVLVADLNTYCHAISQVLAPHTRNGPLIHDGPYYVNVKWTGPMNETSESIGAKGGNVGLLAGSVSWRHIKKMKLYKASNLWDTTGAYGHW